MAYNQDLKPSFLTNYENYHIEFNKENNKPLHFKPPPRSNKKAEKSCKQRFPNQKNSIEKQRYSQNTHSVSSQSRLFEDPDQSIQRNRRQTIGSSRTNNSIEDNPEFKNKFVLQKFHSTEDEKLKKSQEFKRQISRRYAANLKKTPDDDQDSGVKIESSNQISKNSPIEEKKIDDLETSNFSSQIGGKFTYFSRTISTREQTNYNSDVYFQNGEELLPKLYPFLTIKRKRIFKNLESALFNCVGHNYRELVILSKPLSIESAQIILNIGYIRDSLLSSIFFNFVTSLIYNSELRIMKIFIEEVKNIVNRTKKKNQNFVDSKYVLRLENLLKSIEISCDDAMKYLYTLLGQDLNFVKNSIFIFKEILAHGIEFFGGLKNMSKDCVHLRNKIGFEVFQVTSVPVPKDLVNFVSESSKLINEYFSLMFEIELVCVVSDTSGSVLVSKFGNFSENLLVNFWVYVDSNSLTLTLITGAPCTQVVNYEISLPKSDFDEKSTPGKISCIEGPKNGKFQMDSKKKDSGTNHILSNTRNSNRSINTKKTLGLKSKNQNELLNIENVNLSPHPSQERRRQSLDTNQRRKNLRDKRYSQKPLTSFNQVQERNHKIQKVQVRVMTNNASPLPQRVSVKTLNSRGNSNRRIERNSRSINRHRNLSQTQTYGQNNSFLIKVENENIQLERSQRMIYPSRNPSVQISLGKNRSRNNYESHHSQYRYQQNPPLDYFQPHHHNSRQNFNFTSYHPQNSAQELRPHSLSQKNDFQISNGFSQGNLNYANIGQFSSLNQLSSQFEQERHNIHQRRISQKNQNPLLKPTMLRLNSRGNERKSPLKFLGSQLQPVIQKAVKDKRSQSVNRINGIRNKRRKKSPSPYQLQSSHYSKTGRRNSRRRKNRSILGPRNFSKSKKKKRYTGMGRTPKYKFEGQREPNMNELGDISQDELKKRLEQVSKKIRENLNITGENHGWESLKKEERGMKVKRRVFEGVFIGLNGFEHFMNSNNEKLRDLKRF